MPKSPFASFSLFEKYVGFSWIEEEMAEDLAEVYPRYQPTPKEIAFSRQMSALRAQYSLSGAGLGALAGGLVAISALKNKSRFAKSMLTTITSGSGYFAATAWGELKSVDRWVTFERDASFDSWNSTYITHSNASKGHFSFMAEGFRNEMIQSEADAFETLEGKGHAPSEPRLGNILRPLVLHPGELQMVYQVRYEHKIPEELVDSVHSEELTEADFQAIVRSLRILAAADDDDPCQQGGEDGDMDEDEGEGEGTDA
jgi:hypothetical protein